MKTIIADRRWAKKYPKLGTGPIFAESCVSAEYFELERERIFRRSWLNVGAVWEIPGPGDYFVRDLAVCNVSILVMRGRDKEVRVFTTSAPIAVTSWSRMPEAPAGVT